MGRDGQNQQGFRLAGAALDAWAVIAAFGAYFCMYMYRKPYTAATYETLTAFGMAYKPIVIISQVLGYAISKFIGIKVVSEAKPGTRVAWYLGLILAAEAALILAGITPAPYNLIWFFANGLPLGMVFGFVLAFLEGRTRTELLAAGLCTSFVVADGVAKSSGLWVMELGVPEAWMPAAVGAMYLPGILLFGWMLSKIPGQSRKDIELRTERAPMDKAARRALFGKFAFGLCLLAGIYSLTGVLRGVRGDFSREIWQGLNFQVDAAVFSRSELIVAFSVLAIVALLVFVKDNKKAFNLGLALSLAGFGVVAFSLLAIQAKAIDPFLFMVLIGFGLYLPYIAFHTTVFERLIAFTQEKGTIGYLMYVADAASYAGLVVLLFVRNLSSPEPSGLVPFFLGLGWVTAIACAAMVIPAFWAFRNREAAPA